MNITFDDALKIKKREILQQYQNEIKLNKLGDGHFSILTRTHTHTQNIQGVTMHFNQL